MMEENWKYLLCYYELYMRFIVSYILFNFTGTGAVVPGTDYAYSSAYSQYGAAAYGTYGYGGTSSGLLSK